MSFDLSKAFDVIPHHLLLQKLWNLTEELGCKIPCDFVRWMSSYLCNRRQVVIINGITGSIIFCSSGVPQGSLLGAILFLIYTASLNYTGLRNDCRTIKYADDTMFVLPVLKGEDVNDLVSHAAEYMSNWCSENSLKLNMQKTKVLPIWKSLTNQVPIDCNLQCVKELLYLGVWFNTTCDWNTHVANILKKCAQRLYGIRILKGILPKSQLIQIYFSIVRCLVEYAAPLFIGLSSTNSEAFDRLQRRAHAIICGYDCNLQCLPDLSERRLELARSLFQKALEDQQHTLAHLIPDKLPSGRLRISSAVTTRRLKCFSMFMPADFNHRHIR